MVATARVIVVLRSELGTQLSLAQKELQKIIDEKWKTNVYSEWSDKQQKEFSYWQKKQSRIETAIHALGAIQLGDIEDTDLELQF